MSKDYFIRPEDSHAHSLQTLNQLYEYDDFMSSIGTLVDMGCGTGLDLEWWATRTTRDEIPMPLNIKCTGVDLSESLKLAHLYKNIQYRCQDFNDPFPPMKRKFDVVWCHDTFQTVVDPFSTLANWWEITADGGMLVLILPQTTNMDGNLQAFEQKDGCYWHWTLVNLIHVLAVSGWDCASGFFKKNPNDPWLHAVVYKHTAGPTNPRTTRWYDLADLGLLPESAVAGIKKHGYLRQQDLILPWVDKSITTFAKY